MPRTSAEAKPNFSRNWLSNELWVAPLARARTNDAPLSVAHLGFATPSRVNGHTQWHQEGTAQDKPSTSTLRSFVVEHGQMEIANKDSTNPPIVPFPRDLPPLLGLQGLKPLSTPRIFVFLLGTPQPKAYWHSPRPEAILALNGHLSLCWGGHSNHKPSWQTMDTCPSAGISLVTNHLGNNGH